MIIEKTLSNGFELIVQPTNAPVAALQVWVDVGSIDEKPIEAGYCHFLEHMMFKGTSRRTTGNIAGSIEGNGGDMNAFTSFEYTVYHITLSNQRWEVANDILADMLLNSVFTPSEFNPEKEVILEEIKRSEDSPDRQLYLGVYDLMYGKSGYGRPVIGFPTTVKNCSAAQLKSFWKRWYSPALMTLVVAGDVDPDEVERKVRKTWGKSQVKPARMRRRDLGFQSKIVKPKSSKASRPFPINSIRWVGALPGCSLRDSNLAAVDVSSMILGQGETSRLYKSLYREHELVTSVSAGVWAPAGQGMYTFDAEIPVLKADRFKSHFLKEIRTFIKEGPTADELERTKASIEADRIYSTQTMDGLSSRLGFLKTSLGNVRFDLEYLNQIRELSTEDIQESARQYLAEDSFREYSLIPKGVLKTALWNESNSKTLETPKKKATVLKKVVVDRELISLSNEIELVLYPKKDSPILSIQACALGGVRAENKLTSGLGNILSDIWEKGPVGISTNKFAEILERKGAHIDAFSGRNSLGLSSTMLSLYSDDILPLFTDVLQKPALLEEEFKRSQFLALEEIKTMEDELERIAGRIFAETLFEAHPYSFPILGYQESVSKLNISTVQKHFEKYFSKAPIVISACGKFNVQKMIKFFEKIHRPNVQQTDIGKELEYRVPKAARHIEVKKNREQSHIIYGFSGIRISDLQRYDLKILLTVLGGQSGRLFRNLRDKQGLCYSVAPIAFEGIESGYVAVYMGCDPLKRSQALGGIRKELDHLVSKQITLKELTRAKEFLLGRHHMDMQLNSAVASATAFNTLYKLGYDEHLEWQKHISRVSPQSIQKLAEQLFTSPEVVAQVI